MSPMNPKWVALMFALAVAGGCMAQNPLAKPDPYVGRFQGDGVTLEMAGSDGAYTGALTFQGQKMPARLRVAGADATGAFEVNGQSYAFTLAAAGSGFKLTSGGVEYKLERQGAAPSPTPPPTAAPAPASTAAAAGIVGTWRGAQGMARFNADGTGTMDGIPGRYEIHGSQVTLIGAQGQLTLGFDVRGDVLTLTGAGGSAALNRVKEESGAGSVHQELVGKWCWISVTNANQGARQSSRCITLNSNGTYTYAGLTDSYNPYGGATSQSSDSGMWTATETTLTTRSAAGKVITYQLEKRNHPKNVRDPMIVLDGQSFVTAYNKPPW
jgi:hypothetical protein